MPPFFSSRNKRLIFITAATALSLAMSFAGAANAAVSPTQLSSARSQLAYNSGLTKQYYGDTKDYATFYLSAEAGAANARAERARNATMVSYSNYQKLAQEAGTWSSVSGSAKSYLDIAVFYEAAAQNQFDAMSFDIFIAVSTANDGFRAQGKPLAHASSTALDVLRAIKWHGAAPKDWAFKRSLYRRIALESEGNRLAQSSISSAFGRFQFLNQTWSTVGCSKTSDGVMQSVCGLRYIKQRYGTPESIPQSGPY